MKRCQTNYSPGVTSLIALIFATLLLSIIVISFTSIMIRDEQRAGDDELSQSAYDAALAGVEDGKRVIRSCENGNPAACNAITSRSCSSVQSGLGIGNPDEVLIQSSDTSGKELNQAYTCVKIGPVSEYKTTLTDDVASVVPIEGETSFDRVEVSWYDTRDSGATSPTLPVAGGGTQTIAARSAWSSGRPPLLRAQVIQYDRSAPINQAQFDATGGMATRYVVPASTGATNFAMSADARATPTNDPNPVRCSNSPNAKGYYCVATFTLPSVSNRAGLLRLVSTYNATPIHAQVRLLDGTDPVKFGGSLYEIDSTGRANDVFRRIAAQVENSSAVPYPRATVDITGNFCKTFSVTDDTGDYDAGPCTP